MPEVAGFPQALNDVSLLVWLISLSPIHLRNLSAASSDAWIRLRGASTLSPRCSYVELNGSGQRSADNRRAVKPPLGNHPFPFGTRLAGRAVVICLCRRENEVGAWGRVMRKTGALVVAMV
jgi:hypothetical protein